MAARACGPVNAGAWRISCCAALAARDGALVLPVRYLPDDFTSVRDAIREAATTADAIFVSGGTSVGTEDHAPRAAAEQRHLTVMFCDIVDSTGLLKALGDVAKARGMAQVAKDSGLGRESLYKALAPGAKPRFETIAAVMRALNVKIEVGVR